MIKINVLISNKRWKKYINSPKIYINKKLTLLNKGDFFFKKKQIYLSLLLSGSKEIKSINKKVQEKKNK